MNTYKRYTQSDVRYFLKYHHKFPYKHFAQKFDRTVKCIKHLSARLSLKKETILLEEEQNQKLNQFFQEQGINKRLARSEECLNEFEGVLPYQDIAIKLQLTPGGLRKHRGMLGKFRDKRITKKEITFITNNYLTMPLEILSKKVGRTKTAIQLIATRNGINKRLYWKEEEIQYLKDNFKTQSLELLAEKLKRTPKAITHKLSSLKLFRIENTSIELQCEEILKELQIPFKSQVTIRNKDYPKSRYRLDFLIGTNLVIEVYGNFWHCNPKIYPKPIYTLQKENRGRGRKKVAYLKKYGYNLLIIWESEFKNPEKVKKKILASIKKIG